MRQTATVDRIAGQLTEQAFGIPVGNEAEPGRIFHVDNQVAGVVRHFDQEGQRMAPPGLPRHPLDHAGRTRHLGKVLGILLEEAEFLATLAVEFASELRRTRILGEGRQHRTGQLQTTRIGRTLQPADDAETLRIAFIALEIGLLGRREIVPLKQAGGAEPLADGILAGMAEWRVADIVRQAGCGDDGTEIARFDMVQVVPGDDLAADHRAQRAADATRLQAVRQAGTHVIAFGKGENLRLVLHPAKRRGEDNAVIVLLESRPLGAARRLAGTEAFARQQFFPDFAFAHALQIRECDGLRVYSASRAARI